MSARIIKGLLAVNNVPDYAGHCPYIVLRNVDGLLWFYGAYNDIMTALKASIEIENGFYIKNTDIQTEPKDAQTCIECRHAEPWTGEPLTISQKEYVCSFCGRHIAEGLNDLEVCKEYDGRAAYEDK